jgi:hypothetical protein
MVEALMLRIDVAVVSCSLCFVLSAAGVAEARRAHSVAPQYSTVECDAYAAHYARQANVERELLIGSGLGGVAGFAIGSIFAASGVGAAIGVGAGLLVGTVVRLQRKEQLYALSYHDCISGRPQLTGVRRQSGWDVRY